MFTSADHPFRHVSLSPPDVDHDSSHVLPGVDLGTAPQAVTTSERARFQPRKTSTLSYQNSSSRDRSSTRSPKNLVVVIPPPDFPLDQRQLGHVLSMGPRHRLSQGLLMPLFPSMFGQLNAIAREYNFPSTAGLCLYLHINENGVTMTPRVSDESWQYLFGHLFEARQPVGSQQFPIGGSIEFDIDVNKARWFDTWVSGATRDPEPAFPPVAASQASLRAHRRGESQNSNPDGQPVENRWDSSGSHVLFPNSRPETIRHVPRKLSLVDRLETHAVHIPPKSQNLLSSPPRLETHDLSPIPQSAVPLPAKSDLEHRVISWRATTELCPVSMVETYQPSPDVGVPVGVTTMDEYALEHNSHKVANVDEYQWSVTSMGPRTPATESLLASTRPSSVHLDRRANGSVPPTPATATSWGPADNDWYSVISNTSRLPSPDVGERTVEDIMAPRRIGVWGNSFGWRSAITWKEVYPYSDPQTKPAIRVQLQSYDASVMAYPNLVIYPAVDFSPDTGSPPYIPNHPGFSPLTCWGSSFGWQRAVTWQKVYPYSVVTMQSVGPIQLCRAGEQASKYPDICIYPPVYPYFEIYPIYAIEGDISPPLSVMLDESSNIYPNMVIYPVAYPHFDIYPPVVETVKMKESSHMEIDIYSLHGTMSLYPTFVIYPAIYPYFDLYPKVLRVAKTLKQKEVDVKLVNISCLRAEYPNLTIYPSAYPYLEIYPTRDVTNRPSAVWGTSFGWLTAKTWIQVYPLHFEGLPTTKQHINDQSRSVSPLSTYPASYPHFVYSPRSAIAKVGEYCRIKESQCTTNLIPHYPNLVIYPAVYPHFDIYPAMGKALDTMKPGKWQSNLRRRRIEMWRTRTATQVGLVEILPNNHILKVDEPFQLDSAAADDDDDEYSDIVSIECLPSPGDLGQRAFDDDENDEFPRQPWHMVWPYLANSNQVKTLQSDPENYMPVSEYPRLVIYPPVYPHFEIYPSWHDLLTLNYQATKTLANSSIYPVLDIYPAVYPRFDIYPAVLQLETTSRVVSNVQYESIEVQPLSSCPNLDIYNSCYPYSLDYIYPVANTTKSAQTSDEAFRGYPWFVLYPPVYPNIIPYPSYSAEIGRSCKPEVSLVIPPADSIRKPISVKLPVQYPIFELYSAGYPWSLGFIYATIFVDDCSDVVKPYYSLSLIHSPVYPSVQSYPTDSIHAPGALDEDKYESAKAFLSLSKLQHIGPKVPVYPYFDLYPSPITSEQDPAEQDAEADDLVASLLRAHVVEQRKRKTRMELHASVFRYSEKQPVRHSKMHLQLHREVFQEGIASTPSGHTSDFSSLMTKNQRIPVPEVQYRPPQAQDNVATRTSRSRSGTTVAQSPYQFILPLGQPPALPPISPRVRSLGIPNRLPPAVSETPVPRISSPPRAYAHVRSTSLRLSQAVKSMVPGAQRRSSSGAPESPPLEDHKERHQQPPGRLSSLVDRWPAIASSPSRGSASESPIPANQSRQRKESLVLQRARAYEQSTALHQSSGIASTKGMHSLF